MVLAQRHHARCSCAGAGAPFMLAGTQRQYERSRPFAIRHLKLDLRVDFDAGEIAAVATLHFERVAPNARHLVLDAVGFDLRRVTLVVGRTRSPAVYEYDGDAIRLTLPRRARAGRVEVSYRARPRRGMYFLKPDREVRSRPTQLWTQCQDEDARHFMPCHDKPHVKMTSELRVKVPYGFVALSNGTLVREKRPKEKGAVWTYHFLLDQPHPSYLITLVVGHFSVLSDRPAIVDGGAREVPIEYFVPPGREADGRRAFGQTPRMVELFERRTGVPYPWSRYSQIVVSDFIFGGMENTTATTLYEHVLLDERAAIDVESHGLVAHELAHQWFGDHVTCRDWSHAWLNEGFATFFEHVEREDRLGRDEYDYAVEADLEAYLDEASSRYQRPIVCRDYQEPIDLFDRHLYEKGGLVLHMLRRELGEEIFWSGVGHYLRAHGGDIVETVDLQRALEDASGQSLERFFDHWVYRPGHPVLKVKVTYEKGQLAVHVKQLQKTSNGGTPIFAFLLEIAVADGTGRVRRHEKRVSTASDGLVVALQKRPAWVHFDPDLRVAASVSFEAPADMLRNMLVRGDTPRARWTAAACLGKRDDPVTVEKLGDALADDGETWMVRTEAARALGRIRGSDAQRWLLGSARVREPKVRRAVAIALGNYRTSEAAAELSRLAGRDESYLVAAAAARALGRTRQPGARAALLRILDEPSWADVRRAAALDGLGSLRDDRAIAPVLERTRYGTPTPGRRAAISALARLSDSRRVREHLEDLLDDADPHLRVEVVRALQLLGDPKARPSLRRQLDRDLDGRVQRRIRETLRDLADRGAAERRRTQDQLEALRNEMAELRVRLAKVEARSKKPRGTSSRTRTKKVK